MTKQFQVGHTYKLVDASKLTDDSKTVIGDVTLPADGTFKASGLYECSHDITAVITQDVGVSCFGMSADNHHGQLFHGVAIAQNADLESGAFEEVADASGTLN